MPLQSGQAFLINHMQLSKHTSSCYNTRVFLLTNGQLARDYAVTKGPHQVEVFLNMPKDSKIKEVPEGNLSSKMSLKSRLHDTSCIQLDLWNLLFHSPCRATRYSLIYTTCIYPYHKSITFSCQTVTMSSADVVEIIVPLCIIIIWSRLHQLRGQVVRRRFLVRPWIHRRSTFKAYPYHALLKELANEDQKCSETCNRIVYKHKHTPWPHALDFHWLHVSESLRFGKSCIHEAVWKRTCAIQNWSWMQVQKVAWNKVLVWATRSIMIHLSCCIQQSCIV